MKKIGLLLICLVLFLCGSCTDTHQIYRSVFIASVGFEKNEANDYVGYFLLSNSIDVGSAHDTSEIEPEIATVKAPTISEMVDTLRVFSLYVNLRHISSIVLHESVLNYDDVKHITDFVISVYEFDFNNYIFTTQSSIKDLFSFKNPNNESSILSTILDPMSKDNVYPCAEPPHLLNFLREYNMHKTMLLPLLEKENIWEKGEDKETTISHRGVSIINDKSYLCLPFEDYSFGYLKNNGELVYATKEISILFSKYQVSIDFSDKIMIKIKSFYHVTQATVKNISEEELKDIISSHIHKALEYQAKYDIVNSRFFTNKLINEVDLNIELIKV